MTQFTDYFHAYQVYSSNNEASPIYHKWCGLSALASAISRRVWVDQGSFQVFPNLYLILVGDPASGKSIAMSHAKTLIRDLQAASPTQHPAIAPAAITKEALTEMMAGSKQGDTCRQTFQHAGQTKEYTHISIFSNELVTLLGSAPVTMIDFLTDVYDQPAFEVRTKNKGTDTIPGPFVNIVGCMTPTTGDALVKQKLIHGGFARRCCFINDSRRGKPIPRPRRTQEQIDAYAYCLRHLQSLHKTTGPFEWTPAAEKFFDAWYLKKHSIMQSHASTLMKGYYRSMDQMLLRVSMLGVLARPNVSSLVLDEADLVQGLAQLEGLDVYTERTFSGAGRNELSNITDRLLEYLEVAKAPVQKKKLCAVFWNDASAEEFEKCLIHLNSIGRIKVLEQKNLPHPPITFISLPSHVPQSPANPDGGSTSGQST